MGVFLQNAYIAGPMSFLGSVIGTSFELTGAQFLNQGQFSLQSVRIGSNLLLNKATWTGSIDGTLLDIGGNLEVDYTKFNGKNRLIDFSNMVVQKNFRLVNTKCISRVSVDTARIEGNLLVEDTLFGASNYQTEFTGCQIGNRAVFENLALTVPISFKNSIFNSLRIANVRTAYRGSKRLYPCVNVSSSVITRTLEISDSNFRGLNAASIRVEGKASLSKLRMVDEADFQNGYFHDLRITRIIWPENPEVTMFGGMTFNNIGSDVETLKIINQAKYSPDAYASLEAFYLKQGEKGKASEVYIAGCRRARDLAPIWIKFGCFLWDWIIGYGRRAWLVFIWAFVFIVTGMKFFKLKHMVYIGRDDLKEELKADYSPLRYSIDLFVPGLNLQVKDNWMPEPRTFAAVYRAIHMAAGWVMIPIGLLSLSALIN
jgi:hypothetical protein